MAARITLYDVASKRGSVCWSPNVMKARLALNYKGIPFDAEWLTHPEIAPAMQKLGIPPNGSRGPQYTIPTIRFDSNENNNEPPVTDSVAIAAKLNALQPNPPLPLEPDLQAELDPIMNSWIGPLFTYVFPIIANDVIVESTRPYFDEKCRSLFNMSLEEAERNSTAEEAWRKAQPGLEKLRQFVVEHKRDEGPFVLGSQVSWVDFVIAANAEALRRIRGDLFESIMGDREELRALHGACRQWMDGGS